MPGVVGINRKKEYFSSCAFSEKPYKLSLILNKVNNGGCCITVVRTVVVRNERVRLPPSTLLKEVK